MSLTRRVCRRSGIINLAVVRLRLGDLAGGPSSPYPPTTPGLACCLVPTVPACLPRSLSALLPGLCPAPLHTKAEHCGVHVGASSVSVYTVPWGCTGLELSTAAILHLDSADISTDGAVGPARKVKARAGTAKNQRQVFEAASKRQVLSRRGVLR